MDRHGSRIRISIGQSEKYHNIYLISFWVLLHVNPTFAISFAPCTICTFAYTARAAHAKNAER